MLKFTVTLPDLEDNETVETVRADLEEAIQEEYCADAEVTYDSTTDAHHPDSRP